MIRKRNFFKTAGCVISGSAICISGCAPVAFGMESSKVKDFHVGIGEKTKKKLVKALDFTRDWVATCIVQNGILDVDNELHKDNNSLYDEINELLNLTSKCCSEGKNVAFALAIQKALNDVLKGMYNSAGNLISLDELYEINGKLSWNFENSALIGLKKMRSLCMVCKEILEDRKDENGNRKNHFSYEEVDEKARLLRELRFSLGYYSPEDKSEEKTKDLIEEFCKKFGDSGYNYKDESLLEKVLKDLSFVEGTLQCFDDVRKFAYDSYEKIDLNAIHFNPNFEENLKLSGRIQYLYPFFAAIAIKNRVNNLFGFQCLGGMFKFLNKLDKNLFKKPLDKGLSEEKQKEQLRGHEELKKASLEHKKNIIKFSVSKFLNKEEKDKLNKALEPSGYEFLPPIYSQLSQ